MKRESIRRAAFAAVTGLGLMAAAPRGVSGADFRIGINLGGPPPERHHEQAVVLEYDTYCVGYRRQLYDADWQLREAQIEQWHAQEALANARQREGEIAVAVDDDEQLAAQFDRGRAEGDGAAAELRLRLAAHEKRVAAGREDLEASRTLGEREAVADAEARIRQNEAAAGRVAEQLHALEAAASPERFRAARERLPRERDELMVAQDAVYASQRRLDDSVRHVAIALHDRDEALWMLYRGQIMSGHCDFATCGFHVDMYHWGGRMPRDPEVVHAYYVHPVEYWIERPVEIETRVIEVDEVAEVHHIRQIQEKHEPRFREVELVERNTPIERRREYAQRVVVERERIVSAKAEREAAAREHRPVRITAAERTEARAVATKARGDAIAEKREARGEARAEDIKARGDARSEQIKANADARAEETRARADARSETTKARADARSEEIKARADANAERTEARADARTREEQARQAKLQQEQARQEAAKAQREARDKNAKDKNKKDDQASTDPNQR